MALLNTYYIAPYGENVLTLRRRSYDGPAEYVSQDTITNNRPADSLLITVSPRGNPATAPDKYLRKTVMSRQIALVGPNGVIHKVVASLSVSITGVGVVLPAHVAECVSVVCGLPNQLAPTSTSGDPMAGIEVTSTFLAAIMNQES